MNSWCMGMFATSVAVLLVLAAEWLEWVLTCPLSHITMNLRSSQCTYEICSADQRLFICSTCAKRVSWKMLVINSAV